MQQSSGSKSYSTGRLQRLDLMHAMNSSDGASPQKSTRTQPPLVSSETWSSNSHLWPYLGLYLFDTQCDAESQVSPHLLNAVFIDLVNDR